MKIGLDTTFLFDQYAFRGIGNYGREVTRELLKDRNHDWILFGYGNKNANLNELGVKPQSNIHFVSLGNKRKSNYFNLVFFTFKYLPKIKRAKLDLFFSFNFEQGLPIGQTKVAVAVHDVIPLITKRYSQRGVLFNFLKGIFYRFNLNHAKKADYIFTSSDFSKNELVKKAEFEGKKVFPIHLGIKDSIRIENMDPEQRDVRRILITYNITPPYILNYGGIEDNKNVALVIKSFYEASSRFPDLKLVIASKEFKLGWDNKVKALTPPAGELVKLCNELKIKHRVIFTGEIGENHLPVVLANARLMLNLSGYEGFGLSALEALAAGIPLIASNKSCYPEILGDAAILLNPDDTKTVAQNIENVLTDDLLYNKLRADGLKRAEEFTWSKTTKSILKVIEQPGISSINKRVVYVAPYFYPFHGGAERSCLALASGMAELGATATVLTSYRSDFTCKHKEVYNGINIIRFRRLNNAFYLGFYPGLLWTLLRTKADVIHVMGIGFIWQDLCVYIKKIFSPRTQFINTPHGPFMTLDSYSKFSLALKKIYTPLLKFFIKHTYNIVIQDNEEQSKWITKYGVSLNKIKFLPIGIDQYSFDAQPSRSDVANEYDLNKKFVLSFIGRFEQYKGLQFAILAVGKLKNTIKSIKLIAMGVKGRYLETLIELIKKEGLEKHVNILVGPSDETIRDILSLSKIYVFPSQWEAFGISTLEAMAMGNAVITTNTEGGRLLINPNENGFLVDYGDSDIIAEKIEYLFKNKTELNRISKNNIERAHKFSWKNIISRYSTEIIRN